MAMTLDQIRTYCLARSESVAEDMPFGDGVLVFRIHGKIFLLARLDAIPPSVNVKCDPARALEWRERYEGIKPGYHMNKRHWNTVILDGSVPSADIRQMIDDSYELVSRQAAGSGRRHPRPSGRSAQGSKKVVSKANPAERSRKRGRF